MNLQRRVRLLRGASYGVLAFACGAPALAPEASAATVTISTSTTTALATATVDAGNPGDISITGTGQISLAAGTAVTVNSSNTVTNAGKLLVSDAANTRGVVLAPGFTGLLTNTGEITLAAPTDTSATSASGKAAVLVASGGTFHGSIVQQTGGVIKVFGQSSAGIDIEGALDGSIDLQAGTLSVTGANSDAIKIAGAVSGDVINKGTVQIVGISSVGVRVAAPIAGHFVQGGTLSATGYDYTAKDTSTGSGNYNAAQAAKQGGPAIAIGSSIAGGVLMNGTGESGTVIAVSSTTSYGQAPAIVISPTFGAAPSNITIGAVGTGADAFSFINRGTVLANGVYDAITATALRISGATISGTDYTTSLSAGLRNENLIQALASEASAAAISVGPLASVPGIFNRRAGIITASSTSAGPHVVTGLAIEAGASVPSVVNLGVIAGSFVGPVGSAYGIRDLSGGLASIDNRGRVVGVLSARSGVSETPAGSAVAIDVSQNTTGVTLNNALPDDFDPTKDNAANFAQITGAVLFGSGADTFTVHAGNVAGNVSFGGGSDTLNVSGGSVAGNLEFGTGTNHLIMSGGQFTGGILSTGGTLDLAVANAGLKIPTAQTVSVTDATFGAGSVYTLAVDVQTGTSSLLSGTGTIAFQAGSQISYAFVNGIPQNLTSDIAVAPAVNVASLSSLLSATNSILFDSSLALTTSGPNQVLRLVLVRKSAAQLGIAAAQAPMLEPLFQALNADLTLGMAVAGLSSTADFANAFKQFVPDYSGATFESARLSSQTHAAAMRARAAGVLTEKTGGGFWASETPYSINRSSTSSQDGFSGTGLQLNAGMDGKLSDQSLAGFSISIDNAGYHETRLSRQETPQISRFGVGIYGAARQGPLIFNASADALFNDTKTKRDISVAGIARSATGKGKGLQFGADASLALFAQTGAFYFKPEAGIHYMRLNEDGYSESGGANPSTGGNAAALVYDSRSATALTSRALLAVGINNRLKNVSNEDAWRLRWSSELRVGWQHEFDSDPLVRRARFKSGTTWFDLAASPRDADTVIGGIDVGVGSALGAAHFSLDAEKGDTTTAVRAAIGFKFSF